MSRKFRSHLSYSNVMATIAVFVALGGSSYAAAKIGSRQIKDNSVQSKDIRNNTVASKDVRNRSLTSGDFKPGQLPAGATGPRGETGPRGATGATGASGGSLMTGRTNVPDFAFDTYVEPVGRSDPSSETDRSMLSSSVPMSGRNLAVREDVAVSGDAPRIYTLRVNGADTPLTCRISSNNLTCASSGAARAVIPAGSTIALRIRKDTSAGGGVTGSVVRFGWRTTVP